MMDEKLICICNGVTDKEIKYWIEKEGVTNFDRLQDVTGVATGCGRCRLRAIAAFEQLISESV